MGNLAKQDSDLLDLIESSLRSKIQAEEAAHGKNGKPPDSLWGHISRVAVLAEKIGKAEGVDPTTCRLAGLFHDAGKFAGGNYHACEEPEEKFSVTALREITRGLAIPSEILQNVEEAILQLYRHDHDPIKLTKVLFDADNLDKLGFLGVANYFVKAGLRGKGISSSFLIQLTVELTYARHAPKCLLTQTGRQMAAKRAPETILFFRRFLESVRDDGLFNFRIDEVLYDGMIIDVVAPTECECGGNLAREIWELPGLKCSEIHLKHSCAKCGNINKLRFCRPLLIEENQKQF